MTEYVYTPVSDEENKRLNMTYGYRKYSTVSPEALRANFTESQKLDYQQAVIKQNQGKILGISADMVPDDVPTQETILSNFDNHVGLSPMWDQIATEYPAWSKTASDSATAMFLSRENARSMGVFERSIYNYKNSIEFNRIEDQKEILATTAVRQPKYRASATKKLQELTEYQQRYTPEGLSVPFELSKAGHFFMNLAKSTYKNYNLVANEASDTVQEITIPLFGTVGGAMGVPFGGVGAVVGAGVGMGAGWLAGKFIGHFGAVGRVALTAGAEVFGANLLSNMSYQDQIAKGAPANANTAMYAIVSGATIAGIQSKVLKTGIQYGIKTLGSVVSESSLAWLSKLGKTYPILSHISDDVKLNPSSYVGKPLSEAVVLEQRDF